jgi:hypothetical protein
MRTRYEIPVYPSEEAEFMHAGGLSLSCHDMYVKVYSMFLAAITS